MATTPTQDARIRELLLVNLFAVFSERDPELRMRAIVANYTEDVIWSSPEVTARGHEELNAEAQKLIDRTPAFVFTAAGPSPTECLSSRPRPSATTWRRYAMDRSPCCTRC